MHCVEHLERRCSSCKHVLPPTYFDGVFKTCKSCLHKRQLRRERIAAYSRRLDAKSAIDIENKSVHSLIEKRHCSSCKRVSLVGAHFGVRKKTCDECLQKRRHRRASCSKTCAWDTFLLLSEHEWLSTWHLRSKLVGTVGRPVDVIQDYVERESKYFLRGWLVLL